MRRRRAWPGAVACLWVLGVTSCSEDAAPSLKDAASGVVAADAGTDAPPDVPSAVGGDAGALEAGPSCQGCDLAPAPIDADRTDAASGTTPDAAASPDLAAVDAAAGGADTGAETSGGSDLAADLDRSVCDRVCNLVGMVNCPGAMPCQAGCLASLEGKCGAAGYALQLCAAGKQASDFSCESVGPLNQITLRENVCADEQAALVVCAFQP